MSRACGVATSHQERVMPMTDFLQTMAQCGCIQMGGNKDPLLLCVVGRVLKKQSYEDRETAQWLRVHGPLLKDPIRRAKLVPRIHMEQHTTTHDSSSSTLL